MKIRVINTYNDRYTHERCFIGDEKEYPTERAKEIIKSGYAIEVKPPKKIANEDEE